MSLTVTTTPLRFTPKAWIQMWSMTKACPIEISARGLLVSGTDDLVQEFFVPEQECTAVLTTMDSESVEKLNLQLLTDGHDLADLCVYWHSHVKMGTSPSGTDEKTFANMANGRFLWSVITNQFGAADALAGKSVADKDMYIRLDTFDPKQHDKKSVYRRTMTGMGYEVCYSSVIQNAWVKEALTQVRKEPVKVYGKLPQVNSYVWKKGEGPIQQQQHTQYRPGPYQDFTQKVMGKATVTDTPIRPLIITEKSTPDSSHGEWRGTYTHDVYSAYADEYEIYQERYKRNSSRVKENMKQVEYNWGKGPIKRQMLEQMLQGDELTPDMIDQLSTEDLRHLADLIRKDETDTNEPPVDKTVTGTDTSLDETHMGGEC